MIAPRSSNGLYLPTRKPPLGAAVDFGHPLANGIAGAWLFNEGAASARNIAGTAVDDLVPTGANAAWTVNSLGIAAGTHSASGWTNTAPSSALKPSYLKTTIWYGVILGIAGDLTDAPPLYAHYYNSGTSSAPFNCGSIHRYNDDFGLLFAWNNGTFSSMQFNGTLPAFGTPVHIALTLDGTTATAYLNGVVLGTSTTNVPGAGSPISYSGTTFISNGLHPSATVDANAATSLMLQWGRALSASEIAESVAEPYGMFVRQTSARLIFDFTASGGPSPQTVVPDAIATGEVVFGPAVTLQVLPGAIATAEQVYQPTVALSQQVLPGTIATAEQVYAPSVGRSVAPGTIGTAEAVYQPTVSVGSITGQVRPDAIPSAEQVYLPRVLQASPPPIPVAVPTGAPATGTAISNYLDSPLLIITSTDIPPPVGAAIGGP